MKTWVRKLDQILRGNVTRPEYLVKGDVDVPLGGICIVIVALASTYGLFMGSFALARGLESGDPTTLSSCIWQTVASTMKMPLLFYLTLAITFPSLYVFNALVGSQLRMLPLLRLLIASMAVNLAVLASFGPIVAFFSVSTPNYSFILLLNVVVCSVAGFLGLAFLLQTLNRMTLAPTVVPSADQSAVDTPAPAEETGSLDSLPGYFLSRHVKAVFVVWVMLFGTVGAQMSWVLRPLVGDPSLEFQWLRARDSNFFESVWNTLLHFLL